jgi:hypothetical protein
MPSISLPSAGVLAGVSAAAGLAGTAVSAAGAIQSGKATAANASYQAQVAANNALIANQNAEAATQAGAANAAAQSLANRATVSKAVAGAAASGVDVNSGSAADVTTTDREVGQLDTLTTINNAALQAYGYRSAATSDTAQAQLDTAEAAQAPIAGDISAGGDLLSGASSVGSKWAAFQQQYGSTTPAVNTSDQFADATAPNTTSPGFNLPLGN